MLLIDSLFVNVGSGVRRVIQHCGGDLAHMERAITTAAKLKIAAKKTATPIKLKIQ